MFVYSSVQPESVSELFIHIDRNELRGRKTRTGFIHTRTVCTGQGQMLSGRNYIRSLNWSSCDRDVLSDQGWTKWTTGDCLMK